jgi:hypothetical protein
MNIVVRHVSLEALCHLERKQKRRICGDVEVGVSERYFCHVILEALAEEVRGILLPQHLR